MGNQIKVFLLEQWWNLSLSDGVNGLRSIKLQHVKSYFMPVKPKIIKHIFTAQTKEQMATKEEKNKDKRNQKNIYNKNIYKTNDVGLQYN